MVLEGKGERWKLLFLQDLILEGCFWKVIVDVCNSLFRVLTGTAHQENQALGGIAECFFSG